MVTDARQLRALSARLTGLSGDAEVNLPAAFVDGMVRDVQEAEAARAELDKLKARYSLPSASREEWIGGLGSDG